MRRHNIKAASSDNNQLIIPDIPDPSLGSVEDIAIVNTLTTQLIDYLDSINPRYSKIVTLSMRQYNVKQISKELDLKPARVYQELKNAKELVKSYLGI